MYLGVAQIHGCLALNAPLNGEYTSRPRRTKDAGNINTFLGGSRLPSGALME